MVRWRVVVAVMMVGGALGRAGADVKLPALIGDNMVLQRGLPLRIWGWADAGEKVTVSFRGQQGAAAADDQGQWRVTLPAVAEAGGPFAMTIAGRNSLTLQNVLVGEVWVCAGQSNMQWPVAQAKHGPAEIAAANYPSLRFFGVPQATSQTPLAEAKGRWQECNPQSVADFTAVGYFFGRDLHRALEVPVGLINASWGGTCAEAWTTVPSLRADRDFDQQFATWDKLLAAYPQALEKWVATVEAWRKAAAAAKAEGKPAPPEPNDFPDGPDSPNRPGNLYYAMIAPLTNYALRGVIWYQGEANVERAYVYRKLLPLLIADWRRAWGSDLPFYIVSLANFMAARDKPSDSAWAELREAQSLTAALPHNGLAVTIDVGEEDSIHPGDKQTVGQRLALQALGHTYGRHVPCDSPSYAGMSLAGDKVRLRFKGVYGGLVARGSEALQGFAIAGADRQFVWASAQIEGDTVVVHSREVQQPVAVRYAWADNPQGNLYNSAGLPAVPFRTDDWPGSTINNR